MTAYRHREETLNTQLAILLSRFGVKVMPLGLDGSTPRLGSLDFIGTNAVWTQITLDQ